MALWSTFKLHKVENVNTYWQIPIRIRERPLMTSDIRVGRGSEIALIIGRKGGM